MKNFVKVVALAAAAAGAVVAAKYVIDFVKKSDNRERSLSGEFRLSKNKLNQKEADEILDKLEDEIEDVAEEIEKEAQEAKEAAEEIAEEILEDGELDANDFPDGLSEDDLDSLIS
ncbi:MAG: hypothetical protein J6L81_00780 [Clostridia bacterium]|nr:hypothetical protein [Clostridia bacterium]